MKQGLTLVALAEEISRQATAKEDFIAPASLADPVLIPRQGGVPGNLPGLQLSGGRPMALTDLAHKQLAGRLGIPTRYAEKMLAEEPGLWDRSFRTWLENEPAARHQLRTLDGQVRAVLSDRYRTIDNDAVAEAALPVVLDQGFEIASVAITPENLYIKALTARQAEVGVGDVVQAGVIIKNSEVGLGRLMVIPMIYRLVCTNGMALPDQIGAFARTHLGGQVQAGGGFVVYQNDTIIKQQQAMLSEMRDAITSAALAGFDNAVATMRRASEARPVGRPVRAVEVLQKVVPQIRADETESIVERLIRDGDYSQYGMANAVTNLANSVDSYERASELEAIGGRVLTLPSTSWLQVAEAA